MRNYESGLTSEGISLHEMVTLIEFYKDGGDYKTLRAKVFAENYLGKIVAARPETVVVVDALDFGGPPGDVRVAEPDELAGAGPSTHGPAPLAFLEALAIMHPCRCAVVGIQPLGVGPGAAMSPPVAQAVGLVVRAVRRLAK